MRGYSWRRDVLIALGTAIVTTLGAGVTGVLDWSETAREGEFQRLERVTDRLESRLQYWSKRTYKLERQRDTLRQEVKALRSEVATLRWRNRRSRQRIEQLEKQMRQAEGIDPLPPRRLMPQSLTPAMLPQRE